MFNSVSVGQGFIRSLLCLIITISHGFLVQYVLSLFLHLCSLFPSVFFFISFSFHHQPRLLIGITSFDLKCLFFPFPESNSKYAYGKHFKLFNTPFFYFLQIFQGLLAVFYNLGDGDFNLTMLSHRLDNGEWHEVHLERHDNEMTLSVDGGGGRREVTGLPGRSREIIIDPSLVMLGNSFPTGHNKSFQGKREKKENLG